MFIPKKSKIFDKLEKLSGIVTETAQVFGQITHNWKQLIEGCVAMKALEKQADEQVHSINDDVDAFFILPLDKEDISELTELLDDLVDDLEQAANRIKIYRLSKSNEALKRFSDLITQAVDQIHRGIGMIKDRKMDSTEYAVCCERLHDLESEGDQLHREVLEKLLGEGSNDFDGKDPLTVIKWKEIFQTLEDMLDKCEDISVVFSRLRIKYR